MVIAKVPRSSGGVSAQKRAPGIRPGAVGKDLLSVLRSVPMAVIVIVVVIVLLLILHVLSDPTLN